MAKYVQEIVNPELFSLGSSELVSSARLGILALGITAAPVVSETGRPVGMVSLRDLLGGTESEMVRERMTHPVHVVAHDVEIAEAGAQMAAHDIHHLVVVDAEQQVVGVISSLDVVRALLGIPVRYPDAFPHTDSEGLAWTDPAALDLEHASLAPSGPGLLVLIHSKTGSPDLPVWAESAVDVFARVHELLSVPQLETPYLARLLDKSRQHLLFRATPVADPAHRARGLERALGIVRDASGLPKPPETPKE